MKPSSTKSYLYIVSCFVHLKRIYFLPTFKEFGVNSIYKYASTTGHKSKTFALQYLSQKSSKLSPKPLVRKLVSSSSRRHLWLWQYFWTAAYLTTRTFRTLWARESQSKPAVKTIAKQSERKARGIWPCIVHVFPSISMEFHRFPWISKEFHFPEVFHTGNDIFLNKHKTQLHLLIIFVSKSG